MNTKEIKNKIFNDDIFATKIEYILSKAILENPIIHKTVFVYKKQKIILGNNRLYSIYDLNTKEKLYSGIHFQEVAKYIARNIKNRCKIINIINLENDVIRYKEKIDFLKKSIQYTNTETKLAKLSADINRYYNAKSILIKTINLNW